MKNNHNSSNKQKNLTLENDRFIEFHLGQEIKYVK